jgi:hypothetical protein
MLETAPIKGVGGRGAGRRGREEAWVGRSWAWSRKGYTSIACERIAIKRGRRGGIPERLIGFVRRITAAVRYMSSAACGTDVALLAQIAGFEVLESTIYKHF